MERENTNRNANNSLAEVKAEKPILKVNKFDKFDFVPCF